MGQQRQTPPTSLPGSVQHTLWVCHTFNMTTYNMIIVYLGSGALVYVGKKHSQMQWRGKAGCMESVPLIYGMATCKDTLRMGPLNSHFGIMKKTEKLNGTITNVNL